MGDDQHTVIFEAERIKVEPGETVAELKERMGIDPGTILKYAYQDERRLLEDRHVVVEQVPAGAAVSVSPSKPEGFWEDGGLFSGT